MKKINKDCIWLVYFVTISALGILFLTGHIFQHPPAKTISNEPSETDVNTDTTDEDMGLIITENTTEDIAIPVNPLVEEYNILIEQINELELSLSESKQQLGQLRAEKFSVLNKYKEQFNNIRDNYNSLIYYNVKNFNVRYDTGGGSVIRDQNQELNAIGEISKYTPWGLVTNMFTSMSIDNNNRDYEIVVEANNSFGNGMQPIIVDTRAEIENFTSRLEFFEKMTSSDIVWNQSLLAEDKLGEMWETQYLLEYALQGKDLEQALQPYIDEVYKKFYILATATKALEDFYSTLWTDCGNKTNVLNELENQYSELMDLIDPDKTGEIANKVSAEELGNYLIPLIESGRKAYHSYADLCRSASPLVRSYFEIMPYGRTYWYYREDNGSRIMFTDDPYLHIYFANGKPVYVNGHYIYNGLLLNGEGDEDVETVCDEAKWIGYNNRAGREEILKHIAELVQAYGDPYPSWW